MALGRITSSDIKKYMPKKLGDSNNGSSRTKAAENLANSSKAGRTTKYELSGKPRFNFTPGTGTLKAKQLYRNDYQGFRASLNSGVSAEGKTQYIASNTKYVPSFGGGSNNFFASMMKGQMYGQMFTGTISSGISLINSIKGSKEAPEVTTGTPVNTNSRGLEESMNSLGSSPSVTSGVTSNDARASISSMEQCNDSASLRQALESAKEQQRTMDSQTDTLSSAADTAKENLKGLKDKKKTAEKTVKDKESDLSAAKQGVTAKQRNMQSKKLALENADKNYAQKTEAESKAQTTKDQATTTFNNASQAYSQAQSTTAAARTTLANTDKEIDGPNGTKIPNPEYAKAQQALQQAEQAEQQAKTAMEQAKTALDKATQDLQAATQAKNQAKTELGKNKEAVEQAEQELQKAEKELKDAEAIEEKAKEALKTAETDLQDAETALDNAEGAIEKFDQHKKDLQALTSSITKQEFRLTKLETEEIKEYAKLTNEVSANVAKNDKRDNEIDPYDGNGMSRKEKIKSGKMDKTNQKNEELLAKKAAIADNVAKTQILSDNTNVIKNGDMELRSGKLPNGEMVYFIGNKEVTAAEYEAAKPVSA